jgi:hypothetical protein
MRRIHTLLLGGLSLLGLSAGFTEVAQAQNQVGVKEAELACEQALRLGSIEALENYLHRYPDAPTACKALALDTLSQFSPNGRPLGGGNGGGGNYGE